MILGTLIVDLELGCIRMLVRILTGVLHSKVFFLVKSKLSTNTANICFRKFSRQIKHVISTNHCVFTILLLFRLENDVQE